MHLHLAAHYLAFRQYLVQHPDWIIVLAFIVAALEGIAVIGSIIPGVTMVVALSILAGSVDVDVVTLIVAGALGAMTGDGMSYALGHHFKHRIEEVWPFRTHPQWLKASEEFVERHGGLSLVLGRFIGPLRAFVPLAAGIFEMSVPRYLGYSLLSASAWAPVHMLPGYAIGSAVDNPLLPGEEQVVFLGVLLLIVALLTWLLPWLVRRTAGWRERHAPTNGGCYYAADGRSGNQRLAAYIGALCLLGYAALTLALPLLAGLDLRLGTHLFQLRQPALDHLFLAFTLFGDKPSLMTIGGIFIAWLALRREWNTLAFAAITAAICLILPSLFKYLYAVPRPMFLQVMPETYAFPSGQVLSGVVVWGFVYMVVARQMTTELRPWLLATVLTLVVFTAASRPYLGVHWMSDIVGGMLLGIALLAALRMGWYRGPGLRVSPWETLLVVLLAAAFSVEIIVLPSWPFLWEQYVPREVVQVEAKRHEIRMEHRHKHHKAAPATPTAAPPATSAAPVTPAPH